MAAAAWRPSPACSAPSARTAAPTASAPQPTLAELDALIAQVPAAGLPVGLRIEGTPRLEVTAIDNGHGPRPSDETGAGRAAPLWTARSSAAGDGPHSPTGRPGADGPGSGTPESRHGLVGMHERVRLFGGDLEAGAGRDGGFRVAARFPLHGVAR
jgi:hypothetical protein